jgi:hypothetical protein
MSDQPVDERFQQFMRAAEPFWDDAFSLTRVPLLRKALFYYEELKDLQDVPGDILEFGVYRGTMLCFLDDANQILDGTNSSRSVIGFDTFSGFPEEEGTAWQRDNETRAMFRETSVELLRRKVALRTHSRIRLVDGDIRETLPRHAAEWPNKVAMAICDADVADVTKAILDVIWDRVSAGGRIYFDEYSRDGWSETVGVDDFLRERGLPQALVRRARGMPVAYVQL